MHAYHHWNRVPRSEGVNSNQEPLSRVELFYRRQQIVTQGYEACQLTTGRNRYRLRNYRNFSSSVSCQQLQITTTLLLRSENDALSLTSHLSSTTDIES